MAVNLALGFPKDKGADGVSSQLNAIKRTQYMYLSSCYHYSRPRRVFNGEAS